MSKANDFLKKYDTRVRALFASHSLISATLKDGSRKFQNTALSFSRYLTTFYAATFLFLLSSHEQISKLAGGRGPCLWALTILLLCLGLEFFRTVRLYLANGVQTYFEGIFEQIAETIKDLDKQGREDFTLFIDKLGEEYTMEILGKKFEFKLFEAIYGKKHEEIDKDCEEEEEEEEENSPNAEAKSEASQALNDVFSAAEKAKAGILSSIRVEARYIKEVFGKSFRAIILSGLTFILYMIALGIILVSSLIENYETLFSLVIPYLKLVASKINDFI